ncbi:chemotaxis protein CheW [Oligoflexus tunisiensis]|uniref:chemotaxis protein CheW n=1 Tax=Oligoflexus tunisiensis TaxID=708132 RepID=UPI00114C8637|nr:chemotaxis protein CheW [Oligoflexus tunisiensis]
MRGEQAAAADLEQARFIVYRVGSESFASPLLSIKEIVDPLPYCFVPNDHAYFLGLANLRGQIIGVIDLGLRFGMPSSVVADPGVLLIFEEEGTSLGALVSAVESAITVDPGEIREDQPVAGSVPEEGYLGVIWHEDRILPIVSLIDLLHEPFKEPGVT